MKKTLAVILCALMLCAPLCGCAKGEQTVEGILEAFSGHLLTLKATNGEELEFDVAKAIIETAHGLLAGDDILLTYTGSINGSDTSKAVVSKVTDVSQEDSAPTEYIVTGTLIDATMNTMVIETSGGEQLTFSTALAQHDIKNGVLLGNTIIVTYTGDIVSGDTTGIKVVKIEDDDPNEISTAPAGGDAETAPEIKENADNVWTTQAVNVRKGPATTAKRIGGMAKNMWMQRTGICSNGWSRVVYNGAEAYVYTDYLTTTAPAPVVAQPEQPHNTDHNYYSMSGYVEDASNANITIGNKTGEYTFDVGSAQHHYKNGLMIGNLVTIEYSGKINGTDTSSCVVHSVTDTDPNYPEQPDPEIVTAPGPEIGGGVTVTSDTAPDEPEIGGGVTVDPDTSQPEIGGGVTVDPDASQPEIGGGVTVDPDASQPEIGDGVTVTTDTSPVGEDANDATAQAGPGPEIWVGDTEASDPAPVIEPAPEPQPEVEPEPAPAPAIGGGVTVVPSIKGTVQGSTANTLTIVTEEGATYTFSFDGTTDIETDYSDGAAVLVQPDTSPSDSNVVHANAIVGA